MQAVWVVPHGEGKVVLPNEGLREKLGRGKITLVAIHFEDKFTQLFVDITYQALG